MAALVSGGYGHGKLGPMMRRRVREPEAMERFKKAWEDGVTSAALGERFGIRQANVYMLARRLGLGKRERPL